jgi:haloalkane dehalogenase
VHDPSGHPGIDWAIGNQARVAALVLLNTCYSTMASLVPPEAIARFSTPGLWRDLSVAGVSRVDALWQSGVDEQVAKSFANAKARETYLPVFVHQALQIRPAFSEHNRILRDEVATRDAAVPRLGRISKPVLIAFGVSDPNLNAGVAAEFHDLSPPACCHRCRTPPTTCSWASPKRLRS